MNYDKTQTTISTNDRVFWHFGGLDADETGTDHVATVDLEFRLATNGVIVNTLINGEPVITTSAGRFGR
jgi:hypothetical protein